MSTTPRIRLPATLLFLTVASLSGCQAGYIVRQGLGQLRLSHDQIPLETVATDTSLSSDARTKLTWVPRVLAFAAGQLGLNPGDSYQTYVDTEGKPVSYVVSAAAQLALVPYQWQFPIAGRVGYKGFFDPAEAREEEERLRDSGFDTLVTPVQAFSTLGWFRDPVLSTMLDKDLPDLVDLLIHESVHRTIYFKAGEAETTTYNESLASHIAYEGTIRFLESHAELKHWIDRYRLSKERSRLSERILKNLRADLQVLYTSSLSEEEKLSAKHRLFELASRSYARLLDNSEARLPASNALILAAAAYEELVPRFRKLQESVGGEPKQLIAYLQNLPPDELPTLPVVEADLSRW